MPELYMGAKSLENLSENDLTRSHMINQLFPRVRKMEINKNWLLLGKLVYRDLLKLSPADENDFVYLNMGGDATRMVLCGATRIGKTSMLRRIMDMTHISGFHVVFLTDVKNEMRSSKQKQKDEFKRFLHKNDIPQGIKMKVYRPALFESFFNEELPKDNERFSIASEDLTWNEFISALGFDNKNNQHFANILSLYWQNEKNLLALQQEIEESNEKKSTKEAILRAMRPLTVYKVFTEKSTDFIQDLADGHAVVFNVEKFREVDIKGVPNPIQLYIKIIQRMIVEAKSSGKLKNRVLIIMDEAPVFLSNPSSIIFQETKNMVDVQAYLGIYAIFSCQTIDSLAEAEFIFRQSRYIFFPFNFTINDAKKLLEYIQKYDFHPFWKRDLSLALKAMRSDSRGRMWAVLDTHKKTVECFYSYMSLSDHMRTKM